MLSTRHSSHTLMKLQISQETFGKCSNNEFHKNSSSGGAELLHADRHTHMPQVIIAFRNSANSRKNEISIEMEIE